MRHEWLIPATSVVLVAPYAHVVYSAEYTSVEVARKAAFPDASSFEPTIAAADVESTSWLSGWF